MQVLNLAILRGLGVNNLSGKISGIPNCIVWDSMNYFTDGCHRGKIALIKAIFQSGKISFMCKVSI